MPRAVPGPCVPIDLTITEEGSSAASSLSAVKFPAKAKETKHTERMFGKTSLTNWQRVQFSNLHTQNWKVRGASSMSKLPKG